MTSESKYEELIFNLTEILKEKNSQLWSRDFRIKNLQEQLEAAEAKIPVEAVEVAE